MIITNPFSIFEKHTDKVQITMYTNEDGKKILTNQYSAIQFCKQVHGTTLVEITGENSTRPTADAAYTKQINIPLGVYFADCQNFLLYCPVQNIIATVHAGAKGLNAGIISHVCEYFTYNLAMDMSTVFIAGGPSLCKNCAEFTDPRHELPNIEATYRHGRHVDLIARAHDEWMRNKVVPKNIQISSDCTKCAYSTYKSYRAEESVKNDPENRNVCTIELLQ